MLDNQMKMITVRMMKKMKIMQEIS